VHVNNAVDGTLKPPKGHNVLAVGLDRISALGGGM
jgi:hypothetical protein